MKVEILKKHDKNERSEMFMYLAKATWEVGNLECSAVGLIKSKEDLEEKSVIEVESNFAMIQIQTTYVPGSSTTKMKPWLIISNF